VDLVVMATHGRTGLRHLLFGSVAEELLALAPCPVLVVRPPTTPAPPAPPSGTAAEGGPVPPPPPEQPGGLSG
jgi:hypothetical protein